MNGLNYLLQTNLYLLLFMGFYVLVLRNETFFRQNRFFLNTSILLSFLIPFINSDWFQDLFITRKMRETAIVPTQMIYDTIVVGVSEESSSLTVTEAIFGIYVLGAACLLVRFLTRLVWLRSGLRVEKGSAFSFFNTLVVDKELPEASTIINHEKVHMRQWHSADIIFVEIAAIINWFNPVIYLYKKEIRHIHEFIADEEAATLMKSRSDYALLLFSNTLGVDPLYLSNNFFNKSLLKRRIIMLHKTKSHRTGLWKYGFSAPLFMLMLIVSAATVQSEEVIIRPVAEKVLSPLGQEISGSILSAMELEKAPPAETASGTKEATEITADDFMVLKKHIQRTIKYPAAARTNDIAGYVLANFTVKNKKITGAGIADGIQKDLDEEAVRTLKLFAGDLDVPDNIYSILIQYQLVGLDTKTGGVPDISGTNFAGQVVISAMNGDGRQTTDTSDTLRLREVVLNVPQDGDMPQFPGGMKAWREYLTKNLKYPAEARNNNIQGRVILSFVVDTDGTLDDLKVLRGIGGGADEEAVRLLANSPKWIPGKKDGKPVRVAYTMPIFFALSPAPATNAIITHGKPLDSDVRDFGTVEVLPEFPGGMESWGKYLGANLKYPESARQQRITGRVITSFVVEKDGTLSEIKILKGLGSGLDEEAIRVLKASPAWKPGIMNGRPVRVAYTMPITFQLQGKQ